MKAVHLRDDCYFSTYLLIQEQYMDPDGQVNQGDTYSKVVGHCLSALKSLSLVMLLYFSGTLVLCSYAFKLYKLDGNSPVDCYAA